MKFATSMVRVLGLVCLLALSAEWMASVAAVPGGNLTTASVEALSGDNTTMASVEVLSGGNITTTLETTTLPEDELNTTTVAPETTKLASVVDDGSMITLSPLAENETSLALPVPEEVSTTTEGTEEVSTTTEGTVEVVSAAPYLAEEALPESSGPNSTINYIVKDGCYLQELVDMPAWWASANFTANKNISFEEFMLTEEELAEFPISEWPPAIVETFAMMGGYGNFSISLTQALDIMSDQLVKSQPGTLEEVTDAINTMMVRVYCDFLANEMATPEPFKSILGAIAIDYRDKVVLIEGLDNYHKVLNSLKYLVQFTYIHRQFLEIIADY